MSATDRQETVKSVSTTRRSETAATTVQHQ